jgi:hypothetical protein
MVRVGLNISCPVPRVAIPSGSASTMGKRCVAGGPGAPPALRTMRT